MKLFRILAAIAAVTATALLFAAPASAQATRTWVSGVGDDANPCSRTAPCKTFAGAISKTAPAGEINCLDPGGFGALTITKSITISCETGTAGVLVAGTNGFVVAAAPTDVIVIKGLDFEGLGPSGNSLDGIKILTAASVVIEHCIIDGFGSTNGTDGNAVFINNGSNTDVTIDDSLFANNANGGVWIKPTSSANAQVTINNTRIADNKFGVVADGTATSGRVNGVVRDTTIDGSSQNGVTASETSAANDTLVLDHVSVRGSGNNALSASGSTAGLLVGNTTIYGNHAGIVTANSANILSYGTNQLNGNNGADGAFTGPIALH